MSGGWMSMGSRKRRDFCCCPKSDVVTAKISGCCAADINDRLPARPDFHFVKDAKHFSFLPLCTAKEAETMPAICTDAPGFDRTDFHARFHAEAIAFFRKHLVEETTPQ